MKPAQIASAVVAAVLVVLGCVMKFTSLFPVHVMPYIALAIGVSGALATQLLPPFVPAMFPPQVMHVLARLFGAVTALLGVITPMLTTLPGLPPNAVGWFGFAAAVVGALGAVMLPHDTRASVAPADTAAVDGTLPPAPPPVLPTPIQRIGGLLLPFFVIGVVNCGPAGKRVATDIGVCLLDQLPGGVAEVVPEVIAALEGTPADWAVEVARLEGRGLAFAVCAVKAAVAELRAKPRATPQQAVAVARGDAYLAQHGAK